jgi:hypothetical protein
MDLKQFKILLRNYNGALDDKPSFYSLNHLTADDADMTNDKFHKLAKQHGKDDDVRNSYNKIADILEMRILSAVNVGSLDKEMGKMMLRHFHEWDKKSKDDEVENELEKLSDADLEKRMRELGWTRKS